MMAPARSELEQRLAELEAEMSRLKSKVDKLENTKPWWEQITGTFEDDSIYDKAMKHGREYRESQRPKTSPGSKK